MKRKPNISGGSVPMALSGLLPARTPDPSQNPARVLNFPGCDPSRTGDVPLIRSPPGTGTPVCRRRALSARLSPPCLSARPLAGLCASRLLTVGVMARRHGSASWLGVMARRHGSASWLGVMARRHGSASWLGVMARRHGSASWLGVMARRHGSASWLGVMARRHGSASWLGVMARRHGSA